MKSTIQKPHVSVIVHNYNGLRRLEDCLLSLLETNYSDIDIIVVDALTEGIDKWIEKKFKDVRLIHFNRDNGIPSRRNAGLRARALESKYVVFMDEDVVVSKNWLSALVETLESNPQIGAAQPLMLSSRKSGAIDNAGCYIDVFGFPHKASTGEYEVNLHAEKTIEVSYAETAAIIVRCELLERWSTPNGVFDVDYFVHWYDIDFCWRILMSGYKIVLVPSSIVYHERRLSYGSGRLPSKNILINTRNKMMTLIKNYSLLSLTKFLPSSVGLELTKAVVLLKRAPTHAIAIFQALFWTLKNFRSTYAKRTVVQTKIRRVPDALLVGYFLKPNLLRLYLDLQRNYSGK